MHCSRSGLVVCDGIGYATALSMRCEIASTDFGARSFISVTPFRWQQPGFVGVEFSVPNMELISTKLQLRKSIVMGTEYVSVYFGVSGKLSLTFRNTFDNMNA